MKKILLLFSFITLSIAVSFSQAYSPSYKSVIALTNDSVATLTNYQVLLTVNTSTPIAANHMLPSGDDIRFSADSCFPTVYYNYWIESAMNTDTTQIWVMVPSMPGNSITNITMWYGDSLATPTSSFPLTFPDAVIISANTTLAGSINTSWFELNAGDTITLTQQDILTINARNIQLDGVINGNGKGFAIPGILTGAGTVGTGPGAGGVASPMNSGSGGAGYGGAGGVGCSDAGDSPGVGGPVNGTANGFDINLGSSGGSSDNTLGGNGGGAISLNAYRIRINGDINLNGNDGVLPGGARGGGGGSGGGAIIIAHSLSFTSNITSIGGHGSDGTNAANDGGGGGGGGRVKRFHQLFPVNTGAINVAGGTPGINGSVPGGTGGIGSSFDSTVIYITPGFSVGAEMNITSYNFLALDTTNCEGDAAVTLQGAPGDGIFAGTGVTGNQFDPVVTGIGSFLITYNSPDGCSSDTASMHVLSVPVISVSNDGPVCSGGSLNLNATGGGSYSWVGPNSFSNALPNPNISNIQLIDAGYYVVTVTGSNSCISTDSTFVDVLVSPTASASNNGPVCIGGTVDLSASGGASYSWSGPGSFSSIVQNPSITNAQLTNSGVYTVTVTALNQCTNSNTTSLTVLDCSGLDEDVDLSISVYPNPTQGITHINFTHSLNEQVDIKVLDLTGKVLLVKHLGAEDLNMLLDLTTFSNGIYIIQAGHNGTWRSYRIIKS